jgi:hypothetical protein
VLYFILIKAILLSVNLRNVILLNVILLKVILANFIQLTVILPSIVLLSVMAPQVMILKENGCNQKVFSSEFLKLIDGDTGVYTVKRFMTVIIFLM